MEEITRYEAASFKDVPFIRWAWVQNLIVKYITRKVKRKYRRYLYHLEMGKILKEREKRDE